MHPQQGALPRGWELVCTPGTGPWLGVGYLPICKAPEPSLQPPEIWGVSGGGEGLPHLL